MENLNKGIIDPMQNTDYKNERFKKQTPEQISLEKQSLYITDADEDAIDWDAKDDGQFKLDHYGTVNVDCVMFWENTRIGNLMFEKGDKVYILRKALLI